MMKKILFLTILAISLSTSKAQQSITVTAKIFSEKNDSYAGTTPITASMAYDGTGPCLKIMTGTTPASRLGHSFFFSKYFNSTLQVLTTNGEEAWFITEKSPEDNETKRTYVIFTQDNSKKNHLSVCRKNANGGYAPLLDYYFELSWADAQELRRYVVERGSQHNLFKHLGIVRE